MNMATKVNSPFQSKDQLPLEDRPISLILEDIERNIAVMARAAKGYSEREIDRSDRAEEYEELRTLFEAFYQFVSCQMGTLAMLREGMETDIRLVTISELRACSELKRPTLAEVTHGAVRSINDISL